MDIIKITGKNYDYVERAGHIQYCARSHVGLGYGNPWEYNKKSMYAHYRTKTKDEALNCYRKWLNELTDKYFLAQKTAIGLDADYMKRIVKLADSIAQGKTTALAAYEVDIPDYQPVMDGLERCHTEILYKVCLRIINNWTVDELNNWIEENIPF